VFLYQLVQPMSDVPAAALWTLSLALALGVSRVEADQGEPARSPHVEVGRAVAAGLVAGAAIMVRPNLAPLAVFPALLAWPSRPAAVAAIGGVLPGLAAVAWLQAAMFGSPLRSGYGELGSLFAVDHIVPNLLRYPAWLATAHTPVLAAAVLAPLAAWPGRRRRETWLLLGFALAIVAAYLAYAVFDDWWYARFLLPALPVSIVLMVSTLRLAVRRLPVAAGAAVVLLIALGLGGYWLARAADLSVFRLKTLERKYTELGRYASSSLPANAVVLAAQPTGSIRFYAGLPTLSWDAIDPAWLDRVLDELRRRGYTPYLAIESFEVDAFRAHFRDRSAVASLDWPARASIGRVITVYDPADRARYLAGEQIPSERITWPTK
jgi:hypothetical protein